MKGMRIHVYTTPEKLHRASKDMQWKYDGRGNHDSNQDPKKPCLGNIFKDIRKTSTYIRSFYDINIKESVKLSRLSLFFYDVN